MDFMSCQIVLKLYFALYGELPLPITVLNGFYVMSDCFEIVCSFVYRTATAYYCHSSMDFMSCQIVLKHSNQDDTPTTRKPKNDSVLDQVMMLTFL